MQLCSFRVAPILFSRKDLKTQWDYGKFFSSSHRLKEAFNSQIVSLEKIISIKIGTFNKYISVGDTISMGR